MPRIETIGDARGFIWAEQDALFGERFCVGFGGPDFRVREIHRDQAISLVRRNHYSKKTYNASFIHLGVYIADELHGVLQFGPAMNPASQASVVAGTEQDAYLELNRMWLDDFAPRNSESRAISYAIKYIRKRWPKVRWIQSFADERCGLFGTVYQAANFAYCGEHTSTFWELDGEVFHNSLLTDGRMAGQPAAERIRQNIDKAAKKDLRQFRYIFFMRPRFAKGLRLAVKDFPKPDYANRPVDEQGAPLCEPEASSGVRSNIRDAA